MSHAVPILRLLLFAGATACVGTGNSAITLTPAVPARAVPVAMEGRSWSPIALTSIADPALRLAITDLLRFVDVDLLWPGFVFDHPVILVDTRNHQQTAAYCVGQCVPRINGGAGISRLWRSETPPIIEPGHFRYVPLGEWALVGEGSAVAVGFDDRERSVTAAVHEDFHLNYQSHYADAFGDEIGGGGASPSHTTRETLERSYSRSEPVTTELRNECAALVAALHFGTAGREAAFAELLRFTAIRDARRARPGSPSFEEDFWERQEGIPTNLERRTAADRKFADPSVVGSALTSGACDEIPDASYFLLIGGLEAAVLDAFGEPLLWPQRVYPRDGSQASSLYLLIRSLLVESKKGDS